MYILHTNDNKTPVSSIWPANQWLWSKKSQERSSCSVFSAGNHSLHGLQKVKLFSAWHYQISRQQTLFFLDISLLVSCHWPKSLIVTWETPVGVYKSLPKSAGWRDRERYIVIQVIYWNVHKDILISTNQKRFRNTAYANSTNLLLGKGRGSYCAPYRMRLEGRESNIRSQAEDFTHAGTFCCFSCHPSWGSMKHIK